MNKLKVGIAGYGIVGKRRHQYIDNHPQLKTVSVCDRFYDEEQGTLENGVKFYRNYKTMLENEKLDILFVCMTNDISPEVTIAGLNKKLHVFCEKPPGRNVDDIKKVIEAEKANPNFKLKYGFNHRYHDSVKEAMRIIHTKELGEVINMRGVYGKSVMAGFNSDWRTKRDIAGGGILLDQGIHMVDLLRFFAGEFQEVKSFVRNNFWTYDVEDNAYAIMRTEKDVIAILHSTATEWKHHFNLHISLTKGSIILSGILSGTKSYGQETLKIYFRGPDDQGNPKEQLISYIEDNSWRDEIHEFADCILNNQKVSTGSSYDALKTMELVYQIYTSDQTWKEKFNL